MKHYFHLRSLYLALLLTITTVVVGRAQNSASISANCGAGTLSITGYLASNNRVNIQVFKDDVIIGTINDLVGPSVNQSYGISGAGTYRVRFLEVNNDNNRVESSSISVNCSGGGTNPPTNPNPNPPSNGQNSAAVTPNCGAGTLSITGYLTSNNRVNIQVFKDDIIIGTINDLVGPSVNQSYGISGAGTYRVRFLEVNNDNNRVESPSVAVNCSGGGTNPPTNPPTNPNPNPPSGTCSVSNPAGAFDHADCNVVSGWAFDNADLGKTLTVDIYVDGNKVASVLANGDRPDLASYFGNAAARPHGFTYSFPTNASWKNGQNHNITVRICGTNNDLGGAKPVTCSGGSTNPNPTTSPSSYSYNLVLDKNARMADVSGNCSGALAIPVGCVRTMPYDGGAYNFSLNPFWTSPSQFNMWYCQNEQQAVYQPTTSPFFTDPLANWLFNPSDPDAAYSASNGWRLAFKDLGVSNAQGPKLPFFALYNKYTGVLRLFVYNPDGYFTRNSIYSTLRQWKLDGTQSMKPSALLSHVTTNENYEYFEAFANDVSCNPVVQTALSSTVKKNWIYIDFDLAGYDGNNRQTILKVEMQDLEISSLTGVLKGSLDAVGTFSGELKNGGGSNSISDILSGITSTVKSGSAVVNAGDDTFTNLIKFLGSDGSPVGFVGQALSLFSNLVGAFSEGQPQTFSGKLNLTGRLNGTISGQINSPGSAYGSIYLGLTEDLPYNNTPGLHQPVDKSISWGVYSLATPNFQLIPERFNGVWNQYYGQSDYSLRLKMRVPINLIRNQSVDMTLVKSELAYVTYVDGGGTTDAQGNPLTTATAFIDASQPLEVASVDRYPQGYDEYGNFQYMVFNYTKRPTGFILRLTFRAPNGKLVVFSKLYHLPDQIKNQIQAYVNESYDPNTHARLATSNEKGMDIVVGPNPFTESVSVEYTVSKKTRLNYRITSINGQSVFASSEEVMPGKHQLNWNGSTTTGASLPKGMYILEMNLIDELGTKRVVKKLIKQ